MCQARYLLPGKPDEVSTRNRAYAHLKISCFLPPKAGSDSPDSSPFSGSYTPRAMVSAYCYKYTDLVLHTRSSTAPTLQLLYVSAGLSPRQGTVSYGISPRTSGSIISCRSHGSYARCRGIWTSVLFFTFQFRLTRLPAPCCRLQRLSAQTP